MSHRVDMLSFGAHALRGVDREGPAEAKEKPSGIFVGEPVPWDFGGEALCVAQMKPWSLWPKTSTMSPLLPIERWRPSISTMVFR